MKGEAEFLRKWKEERYRCRTDLWYLCTEILGYRDLGMMHRELLKVEAETRGRHKMRLWLLPRGHFKSTILTIGRTIQEVVRSHGVDSDGWERCIAIVSGREDLSEDFVKEIRQHFEMNQRLRMMFPDVCWEDPKAESKTRSFEWTTTKLTFKRKRPRKEPTIRAVTLNAIPAGEHYDVKIVDDAVNDRNAGSSEMIRQTNESLGLLYPLGVTLDDPTDFVGTRYAEGDYYGVLQKLGQMRKDRGLAETMFVYMRAALKDGEPIFPERFGKAALDELALADPYMFACQYMNNPMLSARDSLDAADLRYYDRNKLPPRDRLQIVLACDPARTHTKRSDYSAAVAVGVDSAGNVYLLDGFYERLGTGDIGKKLGELQSRWKPDLFVVEENGLEAFLRPALEQEGLYGWTSYRSKGEKENRIRYVFPFMRRHKFVLPKEPLWKSSPDGKMYDLTVRLMEELSEFPFGAHDDLLDALQAAIRQSTAHSDPERPHLTRDNIRSFEDQVRWESENPEEAYGHVKEWLTDPVYGGYFD